MVKKMRNGAEKQIQYNEKQIDAIIGERSELYNEKCKRYAKTFILLGERKYETNLDTCEHDRTRRGYDIRMRRKQQRQ
jgi:hypothetical protein